MGIGNALFLNRKFTTFNKINFNNDFAIYHNEKAQESRNKTSIYTKGESKAVAELIKLIDQTKTLVKKIKTILKANDSDNLNKLLSKHLFLLVSEKG